MKKIRLIYWHPREAIVHAERLHGLGFEVLHAIQSGPELMRSLRNETVDVYLIDLSRLPSQGRDVAMALRSFKSTQNTPIVFVDGEPEKVQKIEKQLPDAYYTTWDHVEATLKEAVDSKREILVVTRSALDGYAGKPLIEKLGIKSGYSVVLIHPPEKFRDLLIPLPEKVTLKENLDSQCQVIIWFVRSFEELQRDINNIAVHIEKNSLWIAWPKKSSGVTTGVTQTQVRAAGLSSGLVDYKICSIDKTWSGLLFTRRKDERSAKYN